MNGRTSTLLRRYAMQSDRKLSDLKREWNAMSNKERAKARLEMQSEMAGNEKTAEKTAEAKSDK